MMIMIPSDVSDENTVIGILVAMQKLKGVADANNTSLGYFCSRRTGHALRLSNDSFLGL